MKTAVETEKLKWYAVSRCCRKEIDSRLEILLLCKQLMADASTNEVGVTPMRMNFMRNIVVSGDRDGATVPQNPGGKALPNESFMGEDSSIYWDNWLPMLEQVANWNNCHLHGKVQRELDLISGGLRNHLLQQPN